MIGRVTRRLVLACLLVLLGAGASQAAIVWTCTRTMTVLLGPAWLVTGQCLTDGGAYTVGGDILGDGTVAGTGNVLCGSPARIVRQVQVGNGTGPAGTTAGAFVWDQTNRKMQVFVSNGASPAFLNQSTAQVLPANTVFRYLALCD